MKKLIFALLLFACGIAYGQNKYRYAIHAYGGFYVGGTYPTTDASALKIDSIIVEDGNIWFFSEGDSLSPGIPTSATINLGTVFYALADTMPGFTFGDGRGNAAI